MSVSLKITNPSKTANRICKNRKAGIYLAQLWGREMEPYVPMDTGTLKDSYKSFVEPFVVMYKTSYARVMFYGKSKLGKPIRYNRHKHPLATSKWHEQAKRSKSKKIAQEMERFMKTI